MKFLKFSFLFLFLLIPFVFAEGSLETALDTLFLLPEGGMYDFTNASLVPANLSFLVGQSLPGPLGILFANERINLYVTLTNGNATTFGLAFEDKKLILLQRGALSDPSLNVYSDEATLYGITRAEHPFDAFTMALDQETLDYEGVGFLNRIRFGILSLFSSFTDWFGE